MNEMKEWVPVSEVEEETGIPNGTIRRYIRQHGFYLQVRKKHKNYEIERESIEIIKEIRGLYSEGKKVEQIDDILSQRGRSMTVTVEEDDKQVNVEVGKVLSELRSDMNDLKDFNRALLERLDKRDQYIEESIKKRDEQLMNVLREFQETKRLTAATEEEKKSWWQIWK
jgi:DNA-binding transcriptional MerR regulator